MAIFILLECTFNFIFCKFLRKSLPIQLMFWNYGIPVLTVSTPRSIKDNSLNLPRRGIYGHGDAFYIHCSSTIKATFRVHFMCGIVQVTPPPLSESISNKIKVYNILNFIKFYPGIFILKNEAIFNINAILVHLIGFDVIAYLD